MLRNEKQFGPCLIVVFGLLCPGLAQSSISSLNPASIYILEPASFDAGVILSDSGSDEVGSVGDSTVEYDPSTSTTKINVEFIQAESRILNL
jgi:hypothetical protein